MSPVRTGLTFGMTVAVFYALCTVVWALAPGPFLGFMNNLFHGMDFGSLAQSKPFDGIGFVSALLILSVWAFFAGTFFVWLSRRIER